MSKFSIRVIFADDHPAFLLGVTQALAQTTTISLVGSARDSTQLIEVLDRTPCDVLITDYAMPGGDYGDGIAMLAFLRRRYPDLKIGVMTMMDNPAVLSALLTHGASCIVSKADDPSYLVPAIHAAYSGGRFFSPAIDRLMQTQGPLSKESRGVQALSPREIEVVRLFVSGLTVSEIASHLHRSKQTVSGHKVNAMEKLGIERDAELFKYAMEMGLVASSITS